MTYSCEFIPDVSRGIVEIKMAGFFSEDALPSIAADMTAALKQLSCGPNNHLTLVDVTGCKIQSQQIVVAFQKLVTDPTFRSRRLAFVAGSSLIIMQLRRVIKDESYARVFGDHPAAVAWLVDR